jgi:hypothetical protein
MTGWGVGWMQWLGGASDRNNLERSPNKNDHDLATEATPDRSHYATDVVASPGEHLDGLNNEKACQHAKALTQKNGRRQPWTMADRSPDDIERSVLRTSLDS